MQMPELCEDIGIKFSHLWDILDSMPSFALKDTKLRLPITFGNSVEMCFQLSSEGISTFFYSEMLARVVKKPFLDALESMTPKLLENAHYSAQAYSFLTFPILPWKNSVEDTSEAASKGRLKQIRELALDAWCGQLFPPMLKIWTENDLVLNRLQIFISRIAGKLEKLFPPQNGWEMRIGKKGVGFLEGNDMIVMRKPAWKQNRKIALSQERGGQFMALYQRWDENFMDNPVTGALFQHWLDHSSMPAGNLTGRNQRYAFMAFLPDPVRHNWTTGAYFSSDFKYGLDEAKEELVLEIIGNYAQRFQALEEEMDAWAIQE